MYYIYHIPDFIHPCGRIGKIGTSKKPKPRVKRQGYTHFEILEEHTCIFEASRREIQLQKEYGYKVDTKPYWKVCQMPTFESRSKGGKNIPHEARVRGGKKGGKNQPREAKSLGGKIGGKIGGKKSRSLTFTQAEEIRQRYSQGRITQTELAKAWGIPQSKISAIINKKSYIEP